MRRRLRSAYNMLGKARGIALIVIGAGGIIAGSGMIANRYSTQDIWSRMEPKIEQAYKRDLTNTRGRAISMMQHLKSREDGNQRLLDAMPTIRRDEELGMLTAAGMRRKRHAKLMSDLIDLDKKDASREQRCRYMVKAEANLAHESGIGSASRNTSKCSLSSEAKNPFNWFVFGGSIFLMIGGWLGFRNFRKVDQVSQ